MYPPDKCPLAPSVLPVYVDDLIPMGNKELTDEFETHIGEYFEVTVLGDASHFLGIRILRDRLQQNLTLDQLEFTDLILDQFAGTSLKETNNPVTPNTNYISSDEECNPDKRKFYQRVIGSIMYLMLGTRPDLAFAVGLFGRFCSNPSKAHMDGLGHLLGYIKATRGCYIKYGTPSSGVDLVPTGYTDSDFAGDLEKRKSTSGYVFFLSGAAFSWRSRLQDTVASSTMEAEYIALHHASQNAVWIRNFFDQPGFGLTAPLTIYCDNQPAINVAQGEVPHKKAKHFEVKLHAVRDHLQRRLTEVEYVPSEDNQADIFTKPLTKNSFRNSAIGLGICSLPSTPDPDVTSDSLYVDATDS